MEEKGTPWNFSPDSRANQPPHVFRSESVDDLSESDFDLGSCSNKNTKRKTETDMRILSSYLVSMSESREVEMIPPLELDRYLAMFFSVIKKHDGYEYEPASLRGMLCSIERYLRMHNYPNSVTRDIAFINTRNMLKERQMILRERANVVKKCKQETLTSGALEKLKQLYIAKEFGPYSPMAVINSMCLVFVVHLKIRKAIDHKQLLWGDIALRADDGREFLCYEPLPGFEFLRPKLVTNAVHRIYSHTMKDSTWDPIEIYKLYRSKRPAQMLSPDSPFYLGIALPASGTLTSQSWYRTSPIGVNKINDLVRLIRDITGSISHGFGELLTIHPNLGFTSSVNVENNGRGDNSMQDCKTNDNVIKHVENRTGVESDSFTTSSSNKSLHIQNDETRCAVKETDDTIVEVTATNSPSSDKGSIRNENKDNDACNDDEVTEFKRIVLTLLTKMDETAKQTSIQWMQHMFSIKDKSLTEGAEQTSSRIHLSVVLDPSTLPLGGSTSVTAQVGLVSVREENIDKVVNTVEVCDKKNVADNQLSRQDSGIPTDNHDILVDATDAEDVDVTSQHDDDEELNSHESAPEDCQWSESASSLPCTKRVASDTEDGPNCPEKRVRTETDIQQPVLHSIDTIPGSMESSARAQEIAAGAVGMAALRANQVYGRDVTMSDLCTVYPPWTIDPRLAIMFQNRLAAHSQQGLLQSLYASAQQTLHKE